MRRDSIITASLLAAILCLPSCGGGDQPGTPDTPTGDVPAAEEVTVEDVSQEAEASQDRPPTPTGYEIILLTSEDGCIQSLVSESNPLRARVVAYDQVSSVQDIELVYTITAVTDLDGNPVQDGDGSLSSLSATTDGEGIGRNDFRCGMDGGLTYTVEVTAPSIDADPKTYCVTCSDVPLGCLDVLVKWEGLGTAKDVQVQVLPGDYGCDINLGPRTEIDDELLIADLMVPSLNSSIRLENLPQGPVTLRGRAKWVSPSGGTREACFSLGACRDGVVVLPDQCKTVSLELLFEPLNPAGDYESIDKFDFSDLIRECAGGETSIPGCVSSAGDVGKTICCALSEIMKLFNTPGAFLFDNITELAKQALPTIIVDAFVNLFHDAVVAVLEKLIADNAPPWLKQFLTIGGEFVDAITTVELMSNLTLSKQQNNYQVEGCHFWTGIALNFNGQRYAYSITDLQNAQVPVNLLGGCYNARVQNNDQLSIDPHAVNLNYGRLVLFVLNEVVLANITGGQAHSIQEAVHLWIDCKKVSEGILNEIAGWFGSNDPKIIEDACNGAIDLAAPMLENFLEAMKLDTHLALTGSALLVDDDCDANSRVDLITRGAWDGSVQSSGSVQGEVTGTFEAVRKGYTPRN